MVYCTFCGVHSAGARQDDGKLCCDVCGKVLEEFYFSSEPTFFKNTAGQSQLSGNFINSVHSETASRQRALERAKDDMRSIRDGLQIDDYDDILNVANRFYEVALVRNFTRGRKLEQVLAACLYLACRDLNKPFLLIDFSNYLKINVYELGAVYLQLCEALYIAKAKDFFKLVDPSLFIYKFIRSLIPGENPEVLKTARDIIASMKRDWMTTGRKPSGLCGAALYISALSHGIRCSKSDIVRIVHVCEATLTKRLVEFENTESGSLTIEEFKVKEKEFQNCPSTRQPKVSGINEVLCGHKDNGKPYAYRLCKDCYDDFMAISGGIEGGSDPPAFQYAEREGIAKASAEENANGNVIITPSQRLNSEQSDFEKELDNPSVSCYEKLQSTEPESTGVSRAATKQVMVNDGGYDKLPGVDHITEPWDESDNFSDIDDVEVDGYLHNEEEKHYKKIIWEEMNREYLEEQAAKEAAAAAAKAACEANYHNCPEDLRAAQELAAATAAAVAKSRKERQQKRAAEARNSTPAETAAEAARQMLAKKRLSSKINYDVLEKLFDESVAPENPKKKRSELHSDNDERMLHIGNKEHKLEDRNKNGDLGPENDCEDKGGAEEAYGNGLDYEDIDEAYDYDDDYGYDGY